MAYNRMCLDCLHPGDPAHCRNCPLTKLNAAPARTRDSVQKQISSSLEFYSKAAGLSREKDGK
jgi:hypothetical protein